MKYILAFVCCLPVWALCLYGMGNVMGRLTDRIAPLENTHYLLGAILTTIVSFVVPTIFLSLGIAAWVIAELLLGI